MRTKQMIIDEYNKLVSEIEQTRIYDGRGEYNGYICEKCGYTTVTFYKDKGVTPFIIQCPKCGGTAIHLITTRVVPPCVSDRYSEVKNWVRPTIEQLLKMPPAIIDHVLNGGLVFEEELKEKPTDKVEPKFKVGDWIVFNGLTLHIDEVVNGYYRTTSRGDGIHNSYDWNIDNAARLWTIKDAKDGDVLHSTGLHGDCIFIFNGLDNWRYDEPNGYRVVATGYCCITLSANNVEFGIQGPDCIEVDRVKPATKEQRDLLFTKMKEARYKWDAEKKELK